MSVPTTYGHYRLQAMLARFARSYPQVRVELNITNRSVDLVAEGFDLAIRLGEFTESGLVARKLADEALCLVAWPSYLAQAGVPHTVAALAAHRCLPVICRAQAASRPGSGRWRRRRRGCRAGRGEAACGGFSLRNNLNVVHVENKHKGLHDLQQ
jgi:DNA-binding transcriptional LysR family regulator